MSSIELVVMIDQESEKDLRKIEENYLSDFCQKTGIKTFHRAGIFWQSMAMRLFVPTPTNSPISLSSEDLSFMWKQGAWFVHFPVSIDFPGVSSYAFVVQDKNYGFGSIKSSDRRHNIRRAFKYCSVERVSFELLKNEAAPLIADTYLRQGRDCGRNILDGWQSYFTVAATNPLFSAWGAFVKGALAATKVEFIFRNGVQVEALFSSTDLLKYYPMNALLFVSTQQSINMEGISYVSYGMRPVTGEKESLMSFKESMGFEKLAINERLELNPYLKPFFNSFLSLAARKVSEPLLDRSKYARIITGIVLELREQRKYVRSSLC